MNIGPDLVFLFKWLHMFWYGLTLPHPPGSHLDVHDVRVCKVLQQVLNLYKICTQGQGQTQDQGLMYTRSRSNTRSRTGAHTVIIKHKVMVKHKVKDWCIQGQGQTQG